MSTELIYYIGISICAGTAFGTVVAIVMLRFSKARLDKQLDAEYGKRRK